MKNFAIHSFPGFDEALSELKKIEGFPVLAVTKANIMGTTVQSTEKLLELDKRDAPAGNYGVPKGYTRRE